MNKILHHVINSARDFYINPILIIPSLIMFVFLISLSKFSTFVNYKLQTTPLLILWLSFFVILTLIVISYISAGMIGLSKYIISGDNKNHLRKFFKFSNKFWFRNLLVIIIFIALYLSITGIMYLFTLIMIGIKDYITLETKTFSAISFLIYFAFLAGVIIFFTFTNFYLIIHNLSIKNSILKSIILVKHNYLEILSLSVALFAIFSLLDFYSAIVAGLVEFIIIIPYIILLFSRIAMLSK